MEQLGLEEVLIKLSDTIDGDLADAKSFGVKFLSMSGDTREINCRKYTKGIRQPISAPNKRGKAFYNLHQNGTILLHDLERDHPISVKTAMIYGFRDYQNEQWVKVYH